MGTPPGLWSIRSLKIKQPPGERVAGEAMSSQEGQVSVRTRRQRDSERWRMCGVC